MLGIGCRNPHTDLGTPVADVDASANPDQTSEILFDIGLSLHGQASISSESGTDPAYDWNGRPAFKLQKGGKPSNS